MTKDVDAVYTWVDGSDPAFQAAFRRHADASSGEGGAGRYRDNGELRFSLRSLLRFAPWVRRVHILTNGQVPAWLDRSHPRIHLVTHAEVFPQPECLPTFNSNAIEMCLHRIPGLSRRFLYFNDDVFLGESVQASDFFPEDGRQMLFVQNTPLPGDRERGSAHDRACAYTQSVLNRLWGEPVAPRLLPAHLPQAYDRDVLFRLETLLEDEFRRTRSHRIRSADDLSLAVLYAYTLTESAAERGRHELWKLPAGSRQYCFVMIENKPLWTLRMYLDILRKRPQFLCINDDMGDVPAHHPLLLSLRAFLRAYFPWRAPVERIADGTR
ncbi:MAG: stealth family protein [Bryobacteraceae bacterium]